MSSEYVHGRRAVNLYGVNGAYTSLFIKSHSSNTFPHMPRWRMYHLAEKTRAPDHVLRYAHTCDDGMTRGPGGSALSGLQDIALWRQAIAEACILNPDDESMCSLVHFSDKPHSGDFALQALPEFLALADALGIALASEPAQGIDTLKHAVMISLHDPMHLDLIWQARREIEVKCLHSAGVSFMQASPFLKSIERLLANEFLPGLPRDNRAVVIAPVASSVVLSVKLLKRQERCQKAYKPL
ncbi:MAG: hypothetical protein JWR68_3242 [Polaromonas sp.]|nr:hypothetical protein [Polaromonas sp.]